MKSVRKFFKNDPERSRISKPAPQDHSVSTGTVSSWRRPPRPSASTVIPPHRKFIRALSAYIPQAPQELGFEKGDCFWVVGDPDEHSAWYDVHNVVTGARGLVPRLLFVENLTIIPTSHTQDAAQQHSRHDAPPPKPLNKPQVFYAVVLHDFIAERTDELDAKCDDPISVVAHANREWFVGKPIGRLGRPGLIPVSFVEIRDTATGKSVPSDEVEALMDRGDLPQVEDWTRATLNYVQNSIPLGVIDKQQTVRNSPFVSAPRMPDPAVNAQGQEPSEIPRSKSLVPLPAGILLAADVVSFHSEMGEYWFRIDAVYQPYNPKEGALPPAKQLILYRLYNDFYDFQVELLGKFPREAGQQPDHPRILPYMPGPSQEDTHQLAALRRPDLHDYFHGLCDLNKLGAMHILDSYIVRDFLSLRPGDVEHDTPARVEDMKLLFGESFSQPPGLGEEPVDTAQATVKKSDYSPDDVGSGTVSEDHEDDDSWEREFFGIKPIRGYDVDSPDGDADSWSFSTEESPILKKRDHRDIVVVHAFPARGKEEGEYVAAAILPTCSQEVFAEQSRTFFSTVVTSVTLYGALKDAAEESDYSLVFEHMKLEWTYVGGLLLGLAALETSVFAIAPGSSFKVDDFAQDAIASGSIATGLGILCDSWFLLRYYRLDLPVFIMRAKDIYGSYLFFSVSARLPVLSAVISVTSLLLFLGRVAYNSFPGVVVALSLVFILIMGLQFVVWGVNFLVCWTGSLFMAIVELVKHLVPDRPVIAKLGKVVTGLKAAADAFRGVFRDSEESPPPQG